MVTVFFSVLPWLAIAVTILEFSLAEDLPAPEVRRVFLIIGIVLPILTVGVWWCAPEVGDASDLLAALGPAAFLLIHHLLRARFRKWKGEEPVLATVGGKSGGAGRFFFEKHAPRSVQFIDYVYTFLLGAGMLLSAAAALAKIVA